jgi:hypothetical protein
MPVKQARPLQTYSADTYALSSKPAEELLPLCYDYSQVAEEHRAAVMTSARTIKRHEQRTVESMVVIGRELTAVQEKLPHGQFLPWIEQEFGWQRSTAYNLLQLAAKFPTVGNLPTGIGLSALYQLTAAPDSALEEARARQQTGEKITKSVATEIAVRHRTTTSRHEPPGTPPEAPARTLTGSEAVKTEIQGTMDHILRTTPKDPLPRAGEIGGPLGASRLVSEPKVAQLERLPAYLRAAGATLTRLLDGALSAQFDAEQRLFAGNQTQQAISWLDTLVRAANNQQSTHRHRLALLLHRTLPDLREALTLAADADAIKLSEAIQLLEGISVNQGE